MKAMVPLITHTPAAAPGVPPWGNAPALPAAEPPKKCDVLIVGAGLHIEVRRTWGGPIARSPAGVPAIVVDPNHPRVLWVGGYGGHGIAQAFKLGQLAADHLR